AIARMRRALEEYFVGGIRTNLSLFRRVLEDAGFQQGKFNTGFLDGLLATPAVAAEQASSSEIAAISAALFAALEGAGVNGASAASAVKAVRDSGWKQAARREALRSE